MSPERALWSTNLGGLIGAVLLAVPVLRLDQLGARLSRLERLAPAADDDHRWRELYDAPVAVLQRRRQSWSPFDRLCLWSGYAIVLGSQAIRLWLTA